MVGGSDLSMTVYPFILRGVTLAGITSANCPRTDRLEIWKQLAGEWKLGELDSLSTETTMADLPGFVNVPGRFVVAGGTLLAMKGVPPLEEIAQLTGRFTLTSVTPLRVPGLAAERHLVFLKAA